MKRSIILLSTLLAATFASAQGAAAPSLADAQKAYVSGNWKEAAAAYEKVCPTQPADTQVSCNLWEILALSQMGDAKSFKKAGTKLDSLINVTNPQHENYADLVMTRAQFMLYLGKYEKSAEDLIHAIETSRPNQSLVLQKVCTAVLSRTKSEDLSQRCESLKHPVTVETAQAKAEEVKPVETKAEEAKPVAPAAAPAAPAETKPAEAKPAEAKPAEPVAAPAPAPVVAPQAAAALAPVPAAPVADKPAEEYWILQLGAFGLKNNANLLVSNLKKQKIQRTIVEMPRGERILYLVQTGHFSTKEEANSYGEKALAPLNVEFQPLLKK